MKLSEEAKGSKCKIEGKERSEKKDEGTETIGTVNKRRGE